MRGRKVNAVVDAFEHAAYRNENGHLEFVVVVTGATTNDVEAFPCIQFYRKHPDGTFEVVKCDDGSLCRPAGTRAIDQLIGALTRFTRRVERDQRQRREAQVPVTKLTTEELLAELAVRAKAA